MSKSYILIISFVHNSGLIMNEIIKFLCYCLDLEDVYMLFSRFLVYVYIFFVTRLDFQRYEQTIQMQFLIRIILAYEGDV